MRNKSAAKSAASSPPSGPDLHDDVLVVQRISRHEKLLEPLFRGQEPCLQGHQLLAGHLFELRVLRRLRQLLVRGDSASMPW